MSRAGPGRNSLLPASGRHVCTLHNHLQPKVQPPASSNNLGSGLTSTSVGTKVQRIGQELCDSVKCRRYPSFESIVTAHIDCLNQVEIWTAVSPAEPSTRSLTMFPSTPSCSPLCQGWGRVVPALPRAGSLGPYRARRGEFLLGSREFLSSHLSTETNLHTHAHTHQPSAETYTIHDSNIYKILSYVKHDL